MNLFQVVILFGLGLITIDGVAVDRTELIENIRALRKLYNFVDQYKADLNFDGVFGIAIATVLLKSSLKSIGDLRSVGDELEQLIAVGSDLSNHTQDVKGVTRDYYMLTQKILNINKWSRVVSDIRFGGLRDIGAENLKDMSYGLYAQLTLRTANTPNVNSDKCMNEVVSNKCHFSELCQNDMLKGKAYGYPLTHRLIHLLMGKFMRCDMSKYYVVEDRSAILCAEILMENDFLRRLSVPSSTRDLFIEQVLLCGGILGYKEFLTSKMRKYPIMWQEKNGCFKEYPDNEKRYWEALEAETLREHIKEINSQQSSTVQMRQKRMLNASDQKERKQHESTTGISSQHSRRKRYSQYMGSDNCRSHITGLAAAYIAGNIRYILFENSKRN